MNARAELLGKYFFARTDCVAVLAPWGTPCPVDAVGVLEHLLEAHVSGRKAPVVTVARMDDHSQPFTGRFRLGSYTPGHEGTATWVCIDCDGPGHAHALVDPLATALAIQKVCQELGIPAYLEKSGGGQGWHVWIFFGTPVPAAKARALGLAICPRDACLADGTLADPGRSHGVEVFPKQASIGEDGYGNLVWLPCWSEARDGANQFHRPGNDGNLEPYLPTELETVDEAAIDRVLTAVAAASPQAQAPTAIAIPESAPANRPAADPGTTPWSEWRREALAALPLDTIYSGWLTSKARNHGWLECRDPWSPTGDQHPSAGVADGSGEAERGSFHSFISGETTSVFDFLIRRGQAADFADACRRVGELSGVPVPTASETKPLGDARSGSLVCEAGDDPHRLARVYLRQYRRHDGLLTLRFWRHQWWRWEGTHYRVLDAEELRAEITEATKRELDHWSAERQPGKNVPKISKHLISNVIQAVSGVVVVPGELEQPAWLGDDAHGRQLLSVTNGLLDLDALLATGSAQLIPHSALWFSSIHLPYAFEPGASCPRWLAFLDQMLEGDRDRIGLLQEWFGYCLMLDTTLQKFVVLEGEGANGKSVVCDVLAELLGVTNVSHVPLELFGQRFQLATTLGCLANIASEVGELDKAAEGILKGFTAGDRMYFDRKGIPGISAYPTARLILATNNRPRFTDRSSGLWRRMLLLPFRVAISENQQDTLLTEKLRHELPGIFGWAIAGLRRLRQNRRFTSPTVCAEALEEYRTENNPARLFLLEHCQEVPAESTPCAELYRLYRSWCEGNGYHPLGERQFGKEVIRVFPSVHRVRRGGREAREYQYQGLSVSYVSYVSYVPLSGPK